jgi:hypothetical protein|tara:strand:- start:431 stop:652 length:222 start_codon:yes stop_codon:yes gene_type:complete
MYTVEFEHDTFEIVVLDDGGYEDDLRVEIQSDAVFISQWNTVLNEEQNIRISPQMWDELLSAVKSPEGAYIKR